MTLSHVRRVAIVGFCVCASLLVAASVLAAISHGRNRRNAEVAAPLAVGTALQRPRPTPNIPLVDANGKPTSLNSYRGKWVVLAPSMTLCQEVCPMTTGALNELQQDLHEAGLAQKVVVAEVTVDPWRDTPARLRAYAKLGGITFHQLTGTQQSIARLWKFFGVYYHRVAEGHPADIDWLTHRPLTFDVAHTDAVFILDPAGQLRVVDEGMPKISGALSKPLRALLDVEGLRNLAHPDEPWTASEMVDDLDFEMGRQVPASALPAVDPPSLTAARKQLTRSPAALAALHTRAGELMSGVPGLSKQLAALRGYPVVVNVWASWCPACRSEFPLFATAAARYGRRVAFLGIDLNDSANGARAFLTAHPVSYPSYTGSSGSLGSMSDGVDMPTTFFISPNGKILSSHPGEYDTLAALENDIEHYSLGINP